MKGNFSIHQYGEKNICIGGVGKLFYQDGYPLSMCVAELKKQDVEVSLLHLVEELWNNGWSWKTIENKLQGELTDDIDGVLSIDMNFLKSFYDCLEQPRRINGGYEESREMIFKYLFGTSTGDVFRGLNPEPLNWLRAAFDV